MTPLATTAPSAPAAFSIPYGAPAHLRPTAAVTDKTWAKAQDFEAMFVNSMIQHMFTDTGKDGPLGNGSSTGPWRSLLTEQYAKSFVKAGGLGLANQIYKSMLARQSAHAG